MTTARTSQARRRLTAAWSLLPWLTACVTVHVDGGDGQVRTIRHFGLLEIRPSSPEQSVSGSMTGIGLIGGPLGWSLGYTDQRWALLGEDCRVVAWLAPGTLSEPARRELTRAAGVCLLENAVARVGAPSPTPPASGATMP